MRLADKCCVSYAEDGNECKHNIRQPSALCSRTFGAVHKEAHDGLGHHVQDGLADDVEVGQDQGLCNNARPHRAAGEIQQQTTKQQHWFCAKAPHHPITPSHQPHDVLMMAHAILSVSPLAAGM